MTPPIIGETLRVWFLSALVVHGAVAGNPDAKRLYDDLLSNYNKLVRPVVNTSDVLRVCIKLKLSQLIDVVSFGKLENFKSACVSLSKIHRIGKSPISRTSSDIDHSFNVSLLSQYSQTLLISYTC